MTTIPELEQRLELVETRNTRVTADKAWETSITRRVCIAVVTYVLVALYLIVIDSNQPFINAFVPAMGYLLSTLVLAGVKTSWIERRLKRK